jgi:lipopolysaccharide/colanic/teichoic acid biosynthesis glycosyltransferase
VLVLLAVPAALIGALCALAVRLDSRGSALYRQERVGQDGRPFTILKFRTMVDAPGGNPLHPEADRITRVGRVLRRSSLDELPQLLNVLSGDMSIVGPRPTLAYQVERYDERQRRRLLVRPGLTGLAQVRGRNAITWGERIEYDLDYVARQSLWLDLRLLVATVPALVGGRGAGGHPTEDPIAAPPEHG